MSLADNPLFRRYNNIEHTQMTPAKQQQLEVMMARARDELQVGHEDVHNKIAAYSLIPNPF